jgi:hypothetical protein
MYHIAKSVNWEPAILLSPPVAIWPEPIPFLRFLFC